jgi:hypothetical protein
MMDLRFIYIGQVLPIPFATKTGLIGRIENTL